MSYKEEIQFGTDGWRGVIAENFTFKNVAVVAQAIADWVKADFKGPKRVAVGFDARFLSKEFAETVASVLAKNGITVYLSKEMIPTPALSYGVVKIKGNCGIMITASHNPANFNGIKIKTAQGGGASKDITGKVESLLGKNPVKTMPLVVALKAKTVVMHDFKVAYLAFMKNYVDLKKIKAAKFRVIQDVMHGSGGGILRDVLSGSRIQLDYTRADYNPSFGRVKPEPIEDYVPGLIGLVKKEKYDLGLILDGDADRIGAVAPGGQYVNAQRILALICLHLYRNQGRRGGLVKTICGSNIMDNIAAAYNLKLYETPVGFKYISDLMINENIIAGGEEAGGVGVQDYIPERDGNLAGLLLLEMMVYEKKNLKQLLEDMEKEFGRFYYLRADVDILVNKSKLMTLRETKTLLGKKVTGVKDYDGIKLIFEDDSWLMFRPSGTEPLVRAYAEAKSLKRSRELIDYGAKLLHKFV